MTSAWLVPLLAAVVSSAFAFFVWRRQLAAPRPHRLLWGLGLTAYAVASLIEGAVMLSGWSVPLYRVYFPLAAGTVGALGAGTMHLLRGRLVARAFTAAVATAVVVAALAPLLVPLSEQTIIVIDGAPMPFGEAGVKAGGKAVPFDNPGRVAFLLLNVVGGLALIGGALASWWQTRRVGVLLIGVGAMMPFLGGAASTLDAANVRILLQLLGVGVMFVGYLQGRESAPAPQTAETAGA